MIQNDVNGYLMQTKLYTHVRSIYYYFYCMRCVFLFTAPSSSSSSVHIYDEVQRIFLLLLASAVVVGRCGLAIYKKRNKQISRYMPSNTYFVFISRRILFVWWHVQTMRRHSAGKGNVHTIHRWRRRRRVVYNY